MMKPAVRLLRLTQVTLALRIVFYVGALTGVGRVRQQTCVDTYSRVANAKLYCTQAPISAADLLNDRVLSLYEEHDLYQSLTKKNLSRVLGRRGQSPLALLGRTTCVFVMCYSL